MFRTPWNRTIAVNVDSSRTNHQFSRWSFEGLWQTGLIQRFGFQDTSLNRWWSIPLNFQQSEEQMAPYKWTSGQRVHWLMICWSKCNTRQWWSLDIYMLVCFIFRLCPFPDVRRTIWSAQRRQTTVSSSFEFRIFRNTRQRGDKQVQELIGARQQLAAFRGYDNWGHFAKRWGTIIAVIVNYSLQNGLYHLWLFSIML